VNFCIGPSSNKYKLIIERHGRSSIVASWDMFEYAFDVYTNGFFRGVDITGMNVIEEEEGGRSNKCFQEEL
jgi:hypothetical protein